MTKEQIHRIIGIETSEAFLLLAPQYEIAFNHLSASGPFTRDEMVPYMRAQAFSTNESARLRVDQFIDDALRFTAIEVYDTNDGESSYCVA